MWKRCYAIALTACVLGVGAAFFAGGAVRIANRYTLDYGEGMVWWQSANITDFNLVYKPIDRYPYTVVQYTPGYHLVTRWAAALSGDWLRSARLISLAAALGWVLVLGAAVYRTLPARVPALYRIAPAFFGPVLILPLRAMEFTETARVDALGLFFSACGLALFIVSRRLFGQLLACALFVAAVLTKQSLYAAGLACLLAALLVRPGRGAVLAGFTVLAAAVPLAYLMAATHGGFLLNTATYNLTPVSASRLVEAWSRNLAQLAPFAAMALIEAGLVMRYVLRFGAGALRRRLAAAFERSRFHRATIVLTLMLAFAAVQALSVAKMGSNYNYFMEFDLACAVLASLFLFRVLRLAGRARPTPAAAAILLYALILAATAFPAALEPLSPSRRAADRSREALYQRALQLVRQSPGLVYAEDVSLLMAAGKEVPAEAFTATVLVREGRWDETPLVTMIRERKFDAIVLANLGAEERFTPGVRAAILEAYAPGELVGPEYTFYRPTEKTEKPPMNTDEHR